MRKVLHYSLPSILTTILPTIYLRLPDRLYTIKNGSVTLFHTFRHKKTLFYTVISRVGSTLYTIIRRTVCTL